MDKDSRQINQQALQRPFLASSAKRKHLFKWSLRKLKVVRAVKCLDQKVVPIGSLCPLLGKLAKVSSYLTVSLPLIHSLRIKRQH
ncbi:MAG: hypothetical protein K0S07_1635 [Chlamydiales bacterium]|jgi:hypothetical protein|nr:hypothetical protein [Chlamydiales bacterium]